MLYFIELLGNYYLMQLEILIKINVHNELLLINCEDILICLTFTKYLQVLTDSIELKQNNMMSSDNRFTKNLMKLNAVI